MKDDVLVGFTNADLVVKVPVIFDADAPVSTLNGATLDARAVTSTGALVTGNAEVVDASTALVVFPRGSLPPGISQAQLWALFGDQAVMLVTFGVQMHRGLRPV